jgi:hypothetical protein
VPALFHARRIGIAPARAFPVDESQGESFNNPKNGVDSKNGVGGPFELEPDTVFPTGQEFPTINWSGGKAGSYDALDLYANFASRLG